MADGQCQFIRGRVHPARQPQGEGVAHAFRRFDGQRRLDAVVRHGVAADIRSALEFNPFASHKNPQIRFVMAARNRRWARAPKNSGTAA